jgi:hypothetical protein
VTRAATDVDYLGVPPYQLREDTHQRPRQEHRRHSEVEVDAGVLYVDDDPILTSVGKATCMDLCLHVVRTTTARSPSTPSPAGSWCPRTARVARPSSSRPLPRSTATTCGT